MKLGDIVDVRKGRKPEAAVLTQEDGHRRLIQIDDLRPGAPAKYCSPQRREVITLSTDVVLAWDGANAGTSAWGLSGVIGSTLVLLRPKNGNVHTPYLGHFLREQEQYLRSRCKGATVPHIDRAVLAQLEIMLPPLSEQRRIADILDKADALRTKRRAVLAQIDALAQSIFLDMFGDPASNPKGWPLAKLGDFIISASDGPHVSPEYAGSGVPFVSTRHVRKGEIIWEDLKFITPQDAEVHWRKCKPERGDILYTKGGTTGLAATVTTTKPFAIWVHIALLKTRHEKVAPKWLETMLNTDFCYQQSQTLTHGITNRDLGLTRMVGIRMLSPPLNLQREFVSRIASVEKLKAAHSSSLGALESLFASLQQRAFRGELTSSKASKAA